MQQIWNPDPTYLSKVDFLGRKKGDSRVCPTGKALDDALLSVNVYLHIKRKIPTRFTC